MKKILLLIGLFIITGCTKSISNNVSNNVIEKSESNMKELVIKVNDRKLFVDLEDNSSVDALMSKLNEGSITINAHDYGNFEKVGYLGFDLPRNDEYITTTPGDVILYQGNQFSLYYDTNSWDFTKLGHVRDINQDELKKILDSENVTIILECANKEN